jgi:transposase
MRGTYDMLVPLVASVTVANPIQVALIAKAGVKTDPRDALSLARLLAVGMLPSVWVPPVEVRELRALGAHRRRLVKQRTQARNRLRAVRPPQNPTDIQLKQLSRGVWQWRPTMGQLCGLS